MSCKLIGSGHESIYNFFHIQNNNNNNNNNNKWKKLLNFKITKILKNKK